MPPNAVSLRVPGLTLAALRFNAGAPLRVLAVHGWLDNANSFAPLQQCLPRCDLVALDLPGHGHSEHLPPGADYHFLDLHRWIHAAARALEWPDFHLLGHSLGGCIAPFAAIARPERVASLMMLEATGPLSEPAEAIADRVPRSFHEHESLDPTNPRRFDTIECAVAARLRATKMTTKAARLIVERQMARDAAGWYWRYDMRHRVASPAYLTEAQVLAVLRRVTCPVLTVVADEGNLVDRDVTERRLESYRDGECVHVPGHHHMHMDDPRTTAAAINRFLDRVTPRSQPA